jgi:hypothetical protein
MGLKKTGAVILLMLVVSALTAPAAGATPTTASKTFWYANGSKLTGSNTVDCAKAGTGNLTIRGTLLGASLELTATGINCGLGVAKITQSGTAAKGEATLEFTGVTITSPSGCSTPSTLKTSPLTFELYMDNLSLSTVYDRFEATGGGKLATISISGCAFAGSYPINGSFFGRWVNSTGSFANPQTSIFDSSTNGFGSLTLGGKVVTITGEMRNTATSGTTSIPFGANEI